MPVRIVFAAVIVLSLSISVAAQAPSPSQPLPAAKTTVPPQPPTLTAKKPMLAEDVYKNIDTFRGKQATRVVPAMEALRGLIGVECSYCHVPKQWELDDKSAKGTTRKMFDMMSFINREHFGNENKVSCWTCHAGMPVPDRITNDPEANAMAAALAPVSDELKNKPAEEVFKNIQSLQGMPAGRLTEVMAFFAQSLGVPCTHCHVEKIFAKDDKPEKLIARKHLTLVTAVMKKYYGGSGTLGCYTCHRGQSQPKLLP